LEIGGASRNRIAALDTGAATAFDPDVDYYVYALTVSENMIRVGGTFSAVNGESMRGYAKFNR
jgi:hypothetical protein